MKQELKLSNKSTNIIFWFFALIHTAVWTILPSVFLKTIPLDTAEIIMWGREWQWGYYKHPPLVAWLTHLAYLIEGKPGFTVYLLSQLAVLLTFWIVWKFGKKFLTPLQALVGVICLEGIYFFSFPSIEFNHNYLLLPIWAASILVFYETIKNYSWQKWLLIGVLAGLGMLTKYEYIVLLLMIFIFMLVNSVARAQFKKIGLYIAALVFLIVLAPNIIWLFKHNFAPFFYAIGEANIGISSLYQYLDYIMAYLIQQVEAIIPLLLLLAIFFKDRQQSSKLNNFDFQYLLFMVVGPFVLTFILTLFGCRIYAYWTIPYFSFIGCLLIALMRPEIKQQLFIKFLIAAGFIFILSISFSGIGYYFYPYWQKDALHQHFPAKNVASYLTTEWQNKYHVPLKYVIGSRSVVSYVASYSKVQPAGVVDFNFVNSPWASIEKVRGSGAVFIFENDTQFLELKKEYPSLTKLQIKSFRYLTKAEINPFALRYSFLPPSRFRE